MAVYVYFAVSLIGEQWQIRRQVNGKWVGDEIQLYYPIFMTVKFLFFFGWLRVAETLYNPFGEDDDDFELNGLINRHFKVAMNIVEDAEEPPELQKDMFWNQTNPELQDFSSLLGKPSKKHVNLGLLEEAKGSGPDPRAQPGIRFFFNCF